MMRRRTVTLVLAVLAVVAVGLGVYAVGRRAPVDRDRDDPHALAASLRGAERDRILRAVDAVNSDTPRAALVADGRRLFRSTEVVKPGESCQSCHVGGGGVNPRVGTIVHATQEGDFRGARDPIALWGVDDTAPYGWAGREESLVAFVVGTIRSHFAEGERQPAATTAREAAAIAAYLQTLRPPVTDFDRGTLSATARRGERIFVGKGACSACHGGPLLTDNALHVTGVPVLQPGDTDTGAAVSGPLKGLQHSAAARRA